MWLGGASSPPTPLTPHPAQGAALRELRSALAAAALAVPLRAVAEDLASQLQASHMKLAQLTLLTTSLELELAERATPDEVALLQAVGAARLADAQARAAELEIELAAARDAAVSDELARLTAYARVLEQQLAERPAPDELRNAQTAATLPQPPPPPPAPATTTVVVSPPPMPLAPSVPPTTVAVAPVAAAPLPASVPAAARSGLDAADDIERALQRIESLLKSVAVPAAPAPKAEPAVSALPAPPPARVAAPVAALPPKLPPPATTPGGGFVRSPHFVLRRPQFGFTRATAVAERGSGASPSAPTGRNSVAARGEAAAGKFVRDSHFVLRRHSFQRM